jgi:hypothetical protein
LFGISEIGFADYYNSEGERVTDPRDLAVQILRSFDLHLATLDRDTYRKSLTNIRQTLDRSRIETGPVSRMPRGAVIEIDDQTAALFGMPGNVRLSALPSLLGLRKSLRRLADVLSETPHDEPPPRAPRRGRR